MTVQKEIVKVFSRFKRGVELDKSLRDNFSRHWCSGVNVSAICSNIATPVFIYSEAQLIKNIERLQSAISDSKIKNKVSTYVPFFPNSNPHVLNILKSFDVGLLVQMPNEYDIVSQHGFTDLIVSPGYVSNSEISFWNKKKYRTFLASIDEVRFAIQDHAPTISVRIDSLNSDKAGIKLQQLPELAQILSESDRSLECFEVYCGSGNSLTDMVNIVRQIFEIYKRYFPSAKSINFAGGHGFDYSEWDEEKKHFDWKTYFEAINKLTIEMNIPVSVELLFEPARDLLADIGVFACQIQRELVTHSNGHVLVTDGSRMLMPSAQLRERSHNIFVVDKNFNNKLTGVEETCEAMVRGRTILRHDYILPGTKTVPKNVVSGDRLLILDVGAYCATQHMEFLNVPPAPEVLIANSGEYLMVSKAGEAFDKWRNLPSAPIQLNIV